MNELENFTLYYEEDKSYTEVHRELKAKRKQKQ